MWQLLELQLLLCLCQLLDMHQCQDPHLILELWRAGTHGCTWIRGGSRTRACFRIRGNSGSHEI